MQFYPSINKKCYYCQKNIEGKLISDFDEVLKIISQHAENKSDAIMCPVCKSVFCIVHRKQMGWKFIPGYAKANCPKCGANLKDHISVVYMVDDVPEVETSSLVINSNLPLDELIRDLGAKNDYLSIIPLLGKQELQDLKIETALREVFINCNDPYVMAKIVENIQSNNRTRENIAASLTAFTFMKSPEAVHHLMKIYDLNISINVSGSTFKNISPLIKLSLQEIGDVGLEQLLCEMEERGSNPYALTFICETILPSLKPDNQDFVIRFLDITKSLMVYEYLVNTLMASGWNPQSDGEKSAAFIIKRNWNELKKMGSASETLMIKLLSLNEHRTFPYKKVIEILGEIGTEKSIEIINQYAGQKKYKKQTEIALSKINHR